MIFLIKYQRKRKRKTCKFLKDKISSQMGVCVTLGPLHNSLFHFGMQPDTAAISLEQLTIFQVQKVSEVLSPSENSME